MATAAKASEGVGEPDLEAKKWRDPEKGARVRTEWCDVTSKFNTTLFPHKCYSKTTYQRSRASCYTKLVAYIKFNTCY